MIERFKLYYSEDRVIGKLVELNGKITNKDTKEVSLTLMELDNLTRLLNSNISSSGHRCISVYRHAFTFKGNIYNICFLKCISAKKVSEHLSCDTNKRSAVNHGIC